MGKVIFNILQIIFSLLTMPYLYAEISERKVVISLAEKQLRLYEESKLVKTYPVAVGKASTPSPVGMFTITCRLIKPSYYVKHVGEIPPGHENPLGTRWIGLSKKSYGIHGTNVASSIGRPSSSGCIRMRNEDVEDLFIRVEPGDMVEIVEDEQMANKSPAKILQMQPENADVSH